MDYKECGFCGRAVKTPVVHTGKDMVFCCTSCFRAYKALHPSSSETTRKEAGKPNKKKAAANKSSRKKNNKQQKHHVRKRQKRGR